MREAILQELSNQGIHLVEYQERFEEIVRLKPEELREMELFELAENIYILSHYLLYLGQIKALRRIEYNRLKNELDLIIESIKGKTKTEKKLKAVEDLKVARMFEFAELLNGQIIFLEETIDKLWEVLRGLKLIYEAKSWEVGRP